MVLRTDCEIQWRRVVRRQVLGDLRRDRAPKVLPYDVGDAIRQRLAEVGLQGALASGLESVQPPKCGDARVLYQGRGVVEVTRERRQTTVRPPAQGRQTSIEQPVERCLVAIAHSRQQFDGGLLVQDRNR